MERPAGFTMNHSTRNEQVPDLINLLQNVHVAWGDEILMMIYDDLYTVDNNGQIIEWVGAVFNDWIAWR